LGIDVKPDQVADEGRRRGEAHKESRRQEPRQRVNEYDGKEDDAAALLRDRPRVPHELPVIVRPHIN